MGIKVQKFNDKNLAELIRLYKAGNTVADLKRKWRCYGNPLVTRLRKAGVYKSVRVAHKKVAKMKSFSQSEHRAFVAASVSQIAVVWLALAGQPLNHQQRTARGAAEDVLPPHAPTQFRAPRTRVDTENGIGLAQQR